MNMKKNIMAASMALSLGLAGNAHAGAYGIAYNEIFDFTINPSDPTNVLFNNLPAAPTSTASALLNGAGVVTGGPGLNAPAANAPGGDGTTRLDNVFNQFGPPGTYSNADAGVLATIVNPVTDTIQAATIAEASTVGNGSAAANAFNGSTTTFDVQITLLGSGEIAFDFDADPYMRTFLQANALPSPASFVQASLGATITITDAATGVAVFSWAPNGIIDAIGGTIGGTETLDGADLNGSLASNLPTEDFTFDPTGDASFGAGSPAGAAMFAATTGTLLAGTYNFSLAMSTDVSLQKTIDQVPEPATLLLLSSSLLGIGFVGKRRKAAY